MHNDFVKVVVKRAYYSLLLLIPVDHMCQKLNVVTAVQHMYPRKIAKICIYIMICQFYFWNIYTLLFLTVILVTFANDTGNSSFFNVVAAFSYSGANLLQWPHLVKKTNKQKFKCIQDCFLLNKTFWCCLLVNTSKSTSRSVSWCLYTLLACFAIQQEGNTIAYHKSVGNYWHTSKMHSNQFCLLNPLSLVLLMNVPVCLVHINQLRSVSKP